PGAAAICRRQVRHHLPAAGGDRRGRLADEVRRVGRAGRGPSTVTVERIDQSHRIVIASDAKQSRLFPRKGRPDCFVAEPVIGPAEGGTRWPLAMTELCNTLRAELVP